MDQEMYNRIQRAYDERKIAGLIKQFKKLNLSERNFAVGDVLYGPLGFCVLVKIVDDPKPVDLGNGKVAIPDIYVLHEVSGGIKLVESFRYDLYKEAAK